MKINLKKFEKNLVVRLLRLSDWAEVVALQKLCFPGMESWSTEQFESQLKIAIKCVSCHQHSDTALVRSDWKLTGPDGAVAMAGSSAEVLRKGGDGLWRFIFDDATFASRPSTI